SLFAGAGDDILIGGEGADWLDGGTGHDTAYYLTSVAGVAVNLSTGRGTGGDAQGDTLAGIENLIGSAFSDVLTGDAGANVLLGGADDDTLAGGAGADILFGGTGLDTADYSTSSSGVSVNLNLGSALYGDAQGDVLSGVDGLIGSAYSDTLVGFDHQGLSGDVFTNVFYGNAGHDSLDGLGGNDQLYGGDDGDTVIGGSGNDLLHGDAGGDVLSGGGDSDTVHGDGGNDSLSGDAGADSLFGGDGNDVLYGGTGNDDLTGGAGADALLGGDDRDTFHGGSAGDVVEGGEGGYDWDKLDLTGTGPIRILYDPANPENGTVQFLDPVDRHIIDTMTFRNIEHVIPCFTPGIMILTDRGDVAVERLRVGDCIWTLDHGWQELRWIGQHELSVADLVAQPCLRPVCIAAGALGAGVPERNMLVSPQHRMLVTGGRADMLFGVPEVLVAAIHLTGLQGVTQIIPAGVTYIHLLFDQHELIRADGTWTESFQPSERMLDHMEIAQRKEITTLFPNLSLSNGNFPAARLTLKAYEALVLLAD
ncbi:MAG: Hint domain-containing protein, partial [Candidatus Saccharibacteria bacterium]|nr:Hint domain-containing protein [Pseudorhodobacter sp.]